MPIATSKMQCGGIAGLPGQRVMVFVSPGFILSQLFTDVSASSTVPRGEHRNRHD